MAQRLEHLPAMRETWVRSLDREDPLEKEMATNSSILAWRIPWTEEPGGLQSTGSQRVGHHSNFTFTFSSVQSLSHVRLFVTPWTTTRQASLSITNSQSLLKLTSIELVMPSNHLILRILLQRARPGFDPWVGKIPWKRERLPTPVFWPREFHGLGSQTVGDD